ncbi:MAG: hypothetical protein ACI88A_003372 [Paraglaciecola sp.]|jgi:hypothetical protein
MNVCFRTFFCLVALFGVISCGGGSSGPLERDSTTTGGTGGVTTTLSIQLALNNGAGEVSDQLSAATPLTLSATVTDTDGNLVTDSLVVFTFAPDGLAVFSNDAGTASTGTTGTASIELLVGENSGSGEVIATLSTGETARTTYTSAGTTQQNELPASLDLFASSFQLASSGSDEIELIALVKNTQNILMEGVNVTFSVTSDGALRVTQGQTGADGTARAFLSTQNKPENRTITATASVGTLLEQLDIQVVGTQITINGPSSVILADTAEFTIFLADSDGVGVANQTVQLTSQNGNQLSNSSPSTDSEGQLTVNYTANQSGTDVITATALNATGSLNITVQQDQFSFTTIPDGDIPLGQSASLAVTWQKDNSPFAGGDITFTTTRGTLNNSVVTTNASGQASVEIQSSNAGVAVVSAQGADVDGNIVNARVQVEFIATEVDNIIVSASPNDVGPDGQKSTITAVLRDPAGNLVKGKTINFTNDDVSGGTISPATAVTDSNGIASTVYTSQSVTSENAIEITATEPESGLAASTNLTVSGRAQFISIGTGNVIEIPDVATYLKTFAVFVTDANSNPVSNVNLTVTGTPVKSTEFLDPNAVVGEPNYQVIRPAFFKGYWSAFPSLEEFEFWVANRTVGCSNEDVDDDGIQDTLEDTNGDNELTPGNIVSIDSNITTDANGQALINVRYAKTYAAWATIKITVSSPVSGSESQASQFFTLSAAATDLTSKSTTPNSNPFGSGLNSVEDPANPGTFIDDGANLTCENTL